MSDTPNTELPTLDERHEQLVRDSIKIGIEGWRTDEDGERVLEILAVVRALVSGDLVLVKGSEIVDVQSAINAAITVLERADKRTFGACANNLRGAAADIGEWLP